MGMELRDWRALAIGYAAGLAVVLFAGLSWWVPAAAIAATLGARMVWR